MFENGLANRTPKFASSKLCIPQPAFEEERRRAVAGFFCGFFAAYKLGVFRYPPPTPPPQCQATMGAQGVRTVAGASLLALRVSLTFLPVRISFAAAFAASMSAVANTSFPAGRRGGGVTSSTSISLLVGH